MVAGFLAGAYIAVAGRLAIVASAGVDPKISAAASFAPAPGIEWGNTLKNWAFAFLGNFVGAGIFVATTYW